MSPKFFCENVLLKTEHPSFAIHNYFMHNPRTKYSEGYIKGFMNRHAAEIFCKKKKHN